MQPGRCGCCRGSAPWSPCWWGSRCPRSRWMRTRRSPFKAPPTTLARCCQTSRAPSSPSSRLVLGLTVVALQLSSTQFSPRLLRNFLRDRPNQVVLSIFVATFAYSAAGLYTVGFNVVNGPRNFRGSRSVGPSCCCSRAWPWWCSSPTTSPIRFKSTPSANAWSATPSRSCTVRSAAWRPRPRSAGLGGTTVRATLRIPANNSPRSTAFPRQPLPACTSGFA